MKALKISYKKVFSLGNYENEQIGLELEIGEGESASEVIDAAKKFVENSSSKYFKSKMITIDEFKDAEKMVSEYLLSDFKQGENQTMLNAMNTVKLYHQQQREKDYIPF